MVVEVMRTRSQRFVFAWSTGSYGEARYCVVPLARMGLHIETGNDDDPTEGFIIDRRRRLAFLDNIIDREEEKQINKNQIIITIKKWRKNEMTWF